VELVPLRQEFTGDIRASLLLLYGAVVMLLVIACFNVANLLLARSISRRQEIAVRASIGAGRGALVRQSLAESLVLAVIAGLLGVLFARWSLNALLAFTSLDVLPLSELRLDRRFLFYAFAVSVMSGIVVGLLPALVTTHRSLAAVLRSNTYTVTQAPRMQQALVVGQVALTVVLLSGAGLLIRTVTALTEADSGLDRRDLLTMEVELPDARYGEGRGVEFFRQLQDRLAQVPGVESAAAANSLPVTGTPVGRTSFDILGQGESPISERPSAVIRVVTPGYFRTIGASVVHGREFTDADQVPDAELVFVVNQAFASMFLQGRDPLTVALSVGMQRDNPFARIVGVVGDMSEGSLWEAGQPTVFYNHRQIPIDAMVLFLRGRGGVGLTRRAVEAIHELDPNLAVANIRTVDAAFGESVGRERLIAVVSSSFALTGLLLASLGLYGLLAFMVTERAREIGIRMVLGARVDDVLRSVLGGGLGLVAIGAIIGLCGAIALSRSVAFLFFGVTAYDPWTYGAVLTLLAVVTAAATVFPARRAATVDPAIALRTE
jgi:predicted permease